MKREAVIDPHWKRRCVSACSHDVGSFWESHPAVARGRDPNRLIGLMLQPNPIMPNDRDGRRSTPDGFFTAEPLSLYRAQPALRAISTVFKSKQPDEIGPFTAVTWRLKKCAHGLGLLFGKSKDSFV